MSVGTAIRANELRIRSDIAEAFRAEQRRIDGEIKELRRRRREMGKLLRRVLVLGRRAYLLQNKKGEVAARRFAFVQREASVLSTRVSDLRGYSDAFRELDNRHVDMWVTLGMHPLD